MATMHDVARLARASVSTVSAVLTGTRLISPATRATVRAALTELDYQPNAMARGGASRRSAPPAAGRRWPPPWRGPRA